MRTASHTTSALNRPTGSLRISPATRRRLSWVAKEINALRLKYPEPVQFRFDAETAAAGQNWYEQHRQELSQEQNPIVVMAAARTDVHVKKLALLFSAIENMPDDHQIHIEAFDKAIVLADYLQKVVAHLYQNFNFSEEKRLETKILELLAKKPNSTARELKHQIMWASSKQVNEACEELLKNGSLSATDAGQAARVCDFARMGVIAGNRPAVSVHTGSRFLEVWINVDQTWIIRSTLISKGRM